MSNTQKLSGASAFLGLLMLTISANAQSTSLEEKATSERMFGGACDGSAAVKIGARSMLVANDETNVLATYDILGGKPIATRALNELLGLGDDDDEDVKEIDIEAGAIHDNQIWWIGSHGRNKKGKERLNRRSLFATNVPRADLSDLEITSPRTDLLPLLVASELTARFFSPATLNLKPKEGGVNIEAMTFDQVGNLILGFRSPLTGANRTSGDALLVRLSFTEAGYQVSQVQELDLNNRGFRDIIAFDGSFLIIAGLVSKKKRSSIYRWDGESNLSELNLEGIKGFNPEALVVMNQQLFVISDDGRIGRQDEELNGQLRDCKDIVDENSQSSGHPNVYFRARAYSFE